jgi:hypothetical protein
MILIVNLLESRAENLGQDFTWEIEKQHCGEVETFSKDCVNDNSLDNKDCNQKYKKRKVTKKYERGKVQPESMVKLKYNRRN